MSLSKIISKSVIDALKGQEQMLKTTIAGLKIRRENMQRDVDAYTSSIGQYENELAEAQAYIAKIEADNNG